MTDTLIGDDVTTLSHPKTEPTPNEVLIGGRSARGKPLPTPEWISDVKKHLNSLLALSENWDSYGAAAPVPKIVQSAYYGFLLSLVSEAEVPMPYVSPTRTGGVQFEWEQGVHELEMDIVSAWAASYVYENTETKKFTSGALFQDDADGGRFLDIVRKHFALKI